MENNENQKQIEKKYYKITLSNGEKNIIIDGLSGEKSEFKDEIEVYAEEKNGELIEIFTGKKILDVEKNYNSNIFDIRKFIEEKYSLFGVKKEEIAVGEISKKLHFITRAETTKEIDSILKIEEKTKEEANRQYQELLKAEKNFSEEINKGRK